MKKSLIESSHEVLNEAPKGSKNRPLKYEEALDALSDHYFPQGYTPTDGGLILASVMMISWIYGVDEKRVRTDLKDNEYLNKLRI